MYAKLLNYDDLVRQCQVGYATQKDFQVANLIINKPSSNYNGDGLYHFISFVPTTKMMFLGIVRHSLWHWPMLNSRMQLPLLSGDGTCDANCQVCQAELVRGGEMNLRVWPYFWEIYQITCTRSVTNGFGTQQTKQTWKTVPCLHMGLGGEDPTHVTYIWRCDVCKYLS